MDIGKKMRQVQKELRQQKMPESAICEAIPAFYEEKCGQFLYPLIPYDPPQWKLNPVSANLGNQRPKSKTCQPGQEPWTYKKFEQKLFNGVLTIPNLKLEQVPKSIFGFTPSLRIVYLNDNLLKVLPLNLFDDLPLLAWLDLRNNKIQFLPEMTKPHEALRTLLLQDNQIVRLPLTLHFAEELTTIALRGNPVIDPPAKIVELGTPAIITYLKERFKSPEMLDDEPESELDEAITLLPPVHMRQKIAKDSEMTDPPILARSAGESRLGLETSTMPKTRALNYLYSDAFWRHAAQNGPTPFDLLVKAQRELKVNVEKKLAAQKEVILQRIKDKEVRGNFEKVSRQMQLNGVAKRKAEVYRGPNIPFGSSKDELKPHVALNLEDFHKEFVENWERLNEFTANPVPLGDVERAKTRLKEAEEIQQKISNMKLSLKFSI